MAASDYINVYMNNPTAGATDGTAVSTGGTFTAPINFTLDASQNETQKVKLGIRTESGYTASGVSIADLNDTNDRLKLCLTENGTFADSISIGSVSAVNTIFYARASSADTENPQTDRSVSFRVEGVLAAV